jgi:citronellol/citronellal dehydrogenase
MSDAAHLILTKDCREITGNFFVDETLLRKYGVDNFEQYACTPGAELMQDFFV